MFKNTLELQKSSVSKLENDLKIAKKITPAGNVTK